jgi:subtilisin family serine protease
MSSRLHFTKASLRPVGVAAGLALCLAMVNPLARAQQPHGRGVLVRLNSSDISSFDARHNVSSEQVAPGHRLYLIRSDDGRTSSDLAAEASGDTSVSNVEVNSTIDFGTAPTLNQSTVSVLNQSTVSVLNSVPQSYYGTTVLSGYLSQPAIAQIDASDAHQSATGRGVIIADVDNGVDPVNPALADVLIPGYNFYSNSEDWSCYADQSTVSVLNQSTVSVLNQSTVSVLNQSTVSVLNQSTVSVLNGSVVTSTDSGFGQLLAAYPTIGHGTAVAGLLHLIAPEAHIMPLKAFGPDGTATLGAVVSSIYYAVDNGANVLNLSFSATENSTALSNAIRYALEHGVVVVSAAGNDGKAEVVYPGAYRPVLNTASVDANNQKAAFSNYGRTVRVAAPGVGLITIYPDNHWAAVSGTSFSAPLVSGEAALLFQLYHEGWSVHGQVLASSNDDIAGNVRHILGHGLIDVDRALTQYGLGSQDEH